MDVLFLGTRGWYPKYGHTVCVLVRTKDADFIFDCGTGAAKLKDFIRTDKETHLFLSHFHLDHTVGLSFLLGVFRGKKLTIWGQEGVERIVRDLLKPPYFPVTIDKWPFEIAFQEVGEKQTVADGELRSLPLVHSDPSTGFRLDAGGKSIAYITDTRKCGNAVRLAQGADLLIHEATYAVKEYEGNSHSTGKEAGEVAREAGAKRLVLFHNDPEYNEERVAAVLEEARKEFSNCERAEDGMKLKI